ncbi:MerR family transcriptional regulator [Loktanella sp. D2R18]|uniref:MerR family transcriptional regulator n=1 Tax=Rhodobacterales TaxID=204455 RepID=UPI000DEA86EF|nr:MULTISPECIES: MerR family transcriptional regulator [Rhodobacterales]MDO6591552.1 MerR family transcriptional regulator [Yoonia sp. 1_MG-2023]RBW43820.1 MerR family transcriptional regulator [Loktanella sp. D2R18]
MLIGDVAKQSGLTIDTLRFYEKIGLIAPPMRNDGGRRVYGDDVLGWIRFLEQLNATGMKQADRIHYAALRQRGDETLTERREMLEQHREKIAAKLVLMQDTLALMDRKVAAYHDMERKAKGH